MKKWILLALLALGVAIPAPGADLTIGDLPRQTVPSSVGSSDSFPYENVSAGHTYRINLSDLPAMPAFVSAFATLVPDQTGNSGKCLGTDGSATSWVTCGSGGGGSGTVTSVGLTMPSYFSVSGSPVTSSGSFTVTGSSQTANLFLGSPNGSSGAMTPRAIVSADIPTLNQNTTGSAATLSQTLTSGLPLIGAGTGVTTGTKSGNTTKFATTSGTLNSGNTAGFDASGNIVDIGSGGGGGGITSINTDTTAGQTIVTGSTGTDFSIGTSSGVTTIALPDASATARGLLTATNFSLFNGKQSALTFTAPLVNSTGTVTCNAASGSQSGCLSSSDWTSFNGKQSALSFGTATETGSSVLTLGSWANATIGSPTIKLNLADTKFYVGNSSNVPVGVNMSGDATMDDTGSVTVGANKIANSKLAQMTAHTYKGNSTGSTTNTSDVAASAVLADISPLNTKGDLHGFSTVNARVPAGTDGTTLIADSTATLGLRSGTPGGYNNFLVNPDFEQGTATTGWTTTTATSAVETTTFSQGKQSVKLTYSASAGDIAQSVSSGIPNTLGVQMEATCSVNTTLTTMQVCALVGGTETNCQAVSASGAWNSPVSTFIGPANGTSVGVRVKTSTSTTGSAYVDNCRVGPAVGASALPGAQEVGKLTWVFGGAFQWTGQNTTTSFLPFITANASIGAPTVTGNVQAPATRLPAIIVPSYGPGTYVLTARGAMGGISTNSGISMAFTDGTTNGSDVYSNISTGSGGVSYFGLVQSSFTYTASPPSTITFTMAARSASTGLSPKIGIASISTDQFEIEVRYYPTTQQQGYRIDSTPASWSGFHTGTGASWTRASTSIGDLTLSGTVSLTQATNRNFGAGCTTATGNLPGITCAPPRNGRYWVCANTAISGDTTGAFVTFELTDGTNVIADSWQKAATTGLYQTTPICGLADYQGGGVTWKLQAKASSGTAVLSTTSTNARSAIEWSVIELDSPMPAPYLVGGVTSSSTTQSFIIENAQVSCTSSSSITSQSSTAFISSIGNVSSGTCAINFPTGEFSATPTCTANITSGGSGIATFNTQSSTSVVLACQPSAGGTCSTYTANLLCMGPH